MIIFVLYLGFSVFHVSSCVGVFFRMAIYLWPTKRCAQWNLLWGSPASLRGVSKPGFREVCIGMVIPFPSPPPTKVKALLRRFTVLRGGRSLLVYRRLGLLVFVLWRQLLRLRMSAFSAVSVSVVFPASFRFVPLSILPRLHSVLVLAGVGMCYELNMHFWKRLIIQMDHYEFMIDDIFAAFSIILCSTDQ